MGNNVLTDHPTQRSPGQPCVSGFFVTNRMVRPTGFEPVTY